MRHDYKIVMVLFFANISISTGVAFADDKLKATYAVAGTSMCLVAPSGFANDSKGNPTIANGDDSAWFWGNFEARLTFNGDGTGTASGTFMSMPPPPPAKARWVRAPSRTPSLTPPSRIIPLPLPQRQELTRLRSITGHLLASNRRSMMLFIACFSSQTTRNTAQWPPQHRRSNISRGRKALRPKLLHVSVTLQVV